MADQSSNDVEMRWVRGTKDWSSGDMEASRVGVGARRRRTGSERWQCGGVVTRRCTGWESWLCEGALCWSSGDAELWRVRAVVT
jgi:hypothetical protein